MKRKIVGLVLSCLIAVSLVVACGPPAEVKEEVVAEKEEVVAEKEEVVAEKEEVVAEKEEVVAEKEEPCYGGTLNFAASSKPIGWDPALTSGGATFWTGWCTNRPIIGGLDEFGQEPFVHEKGFDSMYIVGDLVESWEWADESTLVWHVRRGVHFHNKPPANGRELDAEDIAVSMRRIWEVPRFKLGYWDCLDSIEATEKYTVELKFNKYHCDWKFLIGMGWYNDIISREAVEQDVANKWEYLCGTGPFMLEDYVTDVGATYVRNPNYWDTTPIDGKEYKLPFVDVVNIPIIKDTATTLAAVRTGKIDWAPNRIWADVADIMENLPVKYLEFKQIGSYCIDVRCEEDWPTHDARVRRALSMAIDREAMVAKVLFGHGSSEPNLLIGPTSPLAYTPVDELPEETRMVYEYHPEEAKQLLADAGYPNGIKGEIMCYPFPSIVDMCTLMTADWAKIGADIEIKMLETGAGESLRRNKQHPIMLFNYWENSMPLTQIQIHAMPPETYRNASGFFDPVYNEMVTDAMQVRDEIELNRKLKEINEYWLWQVPSIVLPAQYRYTLWWPWVKNYSGALMTTGGGRYADVASRIWIDQNLKKEMGH